MTDPEQKLKDLHSTFCRITRLEFKYKAHQRVWYEFWSEGYTKEDLELVLRHIIRQNKNTDKQFRRSFRISMIAGDLQRFDEDLAIARAEERNRRKPPTPREQVLQQWRPVVGEKLIGREVSIKEALINAINQTTEDKDQRNRS